eukprot:CAMPEP_0116004812 /NCGR_PEP_ID=MMETSP0321-20121206/811_1 /TAXON_ID=163516 /ORGANISM="Leptocylindrus danicus var. danicus, Strain B650" /LENGTH=276 /DNA_ID=CAMNT_0003473157 /DNA_START=206 /DNA_END=1036 /DNA_ORIENTATION=-
MFNASAILDPATFCKNRGVSIDGNKAAKRLLRERAKATYKLHGFVLENTKFKSIYSSSSCQQKRGHRRKRRNNYDCKPEVSTCSDGNNAASPFVLEGHGVPPQLLQDHVDLCDYLLYNNQAINCSYANFFGELSVDWVHFLDMRGNNITSSWPPLVDHDENGSSMEHRLNLYLAVMNRIARQFHWSLQKQNEVSSCGDLQFLQPRNWNVRFRRGAIIPKDVFAQKGKYSVVTPIVEMIERKGSDAPFLIRISLQGDASASRTGVPVTLVFEAFFNK